MSIKTTLRNIPYLGEILNTIKMGFLKVKNGDKPHDIALFFKKKFFQIVNQYPSIIAFEPVSMCILDCDFCIIKDLKVWKYRKKTMMSFEDFKKIIDDIYPFTTNIQFSGGEPLLNKDIFGMLDYARTKGISTLLATNAQLLSREGILEQLIQFPPDEIYISYEALDKMLYETIRKKGNFDKLQNGIKKLVELKHKTGRKYPVIVTQMVLTKKNLHYENDFFEAVKKLGADYGSIKPLGVWPEGDASYDREMVENYIIPRSQHKISRHEVDEQGNILFFRRPGQCPAINHAVIGSGGEVLPCWYIVVSTPNMGNALEQSFPDIWKSSHYREYRKKMLSDWAHHLCHRCIGVNTVYNLRKLS